MTNVVLIDQGKSIETHLFMQFDGELYVVNNISELSKTLAEAENRQDKIDKVIIIGREGGMEPAAQEIVNEVRAQLHKMDVPILLITKANAAAEGGLRAKLRDKAEILAVPPNTEFDLHEVPKDELAPNHPSFDAFFDLTQKLLPEWIDKPHTRGIGPDGVV